MPLTLTLSHRERGLDSFSNGRRVGDEGYYEELCCCRNIIKK
jgi:hypothetical protein